MSWFVGAGNSGGVDKKFGHHALKGIDRLCAAKRRGNIRKRDAAACAALVGPALAHLDSLLPTGEALVSLGLGDLGLEDS